ncbi:hypothetical protein Pcinc_032076 [Petrolisthes cinctipes]|uniref:Uncharacterized protein n=1 Tax=Petrolisthes cinctipes TaxID=88211 RepID=A0AAE1EVA1_PETCI|nr:hypothetical protein Pcinc_032076 [Petrolisthes cinctipes]
MNSDGQFSSDANQHREEKTSRCCKNLSTGSQDLHDVKGYVTNKPRLPSFFPLDTHHLSHPRVDRREEGGANQPVSVVLEAVKGGGCCGS